MSSPGSLRIGDRCVGEGHPCFIIAEVGVNHNGSLNTALELVDVAVAAGADAVKFQKRDLISLYPAELLENPNTAEWAFQYLIPVLQQIELSADDFRCIKEYCDLHSIRFMCSPWDEKSLQFLEELEVEVYKVGSADLVNIPLLERIAATEKPIILSTGMATLEEIECTVDFLKSLDARFALLHCVSTYPAPFESLNLRFLETLARFGVPVGYSGHERGIAMPLVALTLGACIVERHITLDRTLPGPDHAASLEPQGFHKQVRDIRNAEVALGSTDKELTSMELVNRQVLRKSLVAAQDISAGTIITRGMVAIRGPGKGLTPQRLDELLGVSVDRDIRTNECFVDSDLRSAAPSELLTDGLKRRWGLKARFHDLDLILRHKPRLVELHMSELDLGAASFQPPTEAYPQQLFIHAPEFAESRLLDLCSDDDAWLEKSLSVFQETIAAAAELQKHFSGGPACIVFHLGGMSMDEQVAQKERLLRRAADAFQKLDSRDLVLLPENLPPRPWYLGGQWYQNVFVRAEEMVDFCQELGLGMTLDLSHAQLYCNYAGEDLIRYVSTCLPLVRHVHFADASGIDREGLQIGEGEINWAPVLSVLSRNESFSWVPEIWSGHLENAGEFVEAVNRLAEYGVL